MNTTQDMYEKDFKILLISDIISSFGSSLTATALTIYIFSISNNLLTASLFPFFTVLPKVVLTPFVGKFNFGVSYRKYFSTFEMILGLIMLNLIWINSIPLLLIFYIVFSTVFFFLEIYRAEFLKVICNDDNIHRRQSLSRTFNTAVTVVGPVTAGIILEKTNVNFVYITDFITYIIAGILILFISKDLKMKKSKHSKIKKIKFKFENNYIFIGSVFITFLGGTTSLLTLSYIIYFLNQSSASYGMIMTNMSMGSVLGSLAINIPFFKKHKNSTTSIAILFSGLIILSVIFKPGYILLNFILFISGIFSSYTMTVLAIALYIKYSVEEIKEKYALFSLLIDSSTAVSKPFAGVIEKYFGVITSLIIMGTGFVLLSVYKMLNSLILNIKKNAA
ncbi:MFS transporter [Geotoga petraea]|nr:MFS transporter [Geotoga petraea]